MKTRADIETALKTELEHNWFPRQCRNPYADFYIYYLPTTPEHIGHISICAEVPSNHEMQLVTGEKINKMATIEQNFNHFRNMLNHLPVLEY
jgi:hypothetical protein